MSLQRKKKPVEFHFVDMNDPERYKKLKVARACDFCRRRKSKCDIGIPGSGTCSNCQKHQMVCIFSPVTTSTRGNEILLRPEDTLMTPQQQFNTSEQFLFRFPLLQIKHGQVGYEIMDDISLISPPITTSSPVVCKNTSEPSIGLESKLFKLYFDNVHPAYPVLLKQSIMNIHSQDRLLLSKALRYAIMALACHYFPSSLKSPSLLPSTPGSCSSTIDNNITTASHYLYEIARQELGLCPTTLSSPSSLSPRLDTVQTLLLLYKHDEIASSRNGIYYLETAQELIGQLSSAIPQQQEMINRARWILFSCISLSNLSDKHYNKLYTHVDLPVELPQALAEEIEDDEENTMVSSAHQHVNRFAQIANLSVLYSHTVQSMITGSASHLICLKQFKEIRQHWHDSLHPATQSRLVSLCATDEEEIDILILYSAVLYDMLYLLLLSHYHLETEWDGVETAYRLQRMVHTWVIRSSFTSAVQSRRMSSFALMLCLQIQISRQDDKIDYEFIQQIRQSMKYIQLDPRIDKELTDLYDLLTTQKSNQLTPQIQQPQQQQPIDYFSLIPQQFMNSTSSSPIDNQVNTPGLWSTTMNGGLMTPIREEAMNNHQVTSEWIVEQQRQQSQQFQLYQLQPQQYQTTMPTAYSSTNINYNSSNNNTPLTTTPSYNNMNNNTTEDYFFLNPDHWSPTIDQLNTSTNYLKLHNNEEESSSIPPFNLHHPPPPPPMI